MARKINPDSPFAELFKFTRKPEPRNNSNYDSGWIEESSSVCSATEEEEWKRFQKIESERLAWKGERPAPQSSAGAGVGDSSSINSSIIYGSHMSGMERNTVQSVTETTRSMSEMDVFGNYKKIQKKQEQNQLPIAQHREAILERVNDNQVIVLTGHTGCGKTTQVPQFILDDASSRRIPCNIIVTQPRKIAAQSVARRVCEENGWRLGGLVGYQVGLDKENKSEDTRLLYVTTGILKSRLVNRDKLSDYTHIILDEVHERELDMDLILIILKKILFDPVNVRMKLIIMSATMNEEKFQKYFSFRLPNIPQIPAPLLNVGFNANSGRGTNLKVSVFYLESILDAGEEVENFELENPQLMELCIEKCNSIMDTLDGLDRQDKNVISGAVLVFLPGIGEIMALKERLEQRKLSDGTPLIIYPLHSSIPWKDTGKIFDEAKVGFRKVILSTNIAESSLTVPDIRYIVDFCLTKNVVMEPVTKYPRLTLQWASKQQIKQRKGRVGRISTGRVFRLIPQDFKAKLPESHVPEMRRVPLTKVVLEAKLCGYGTPKQILALAMDPPVLADIRTAIMDLKEMGALLLTADGKKSIEDGDITVLGEIVTRLPLDIKLGKLTVFGHLFGVLEETCIIAAGLNGKSIFTSPLGREADAYKKKIYWANNTFSDCYAVLHAFQTWEDEQFFNLGPKVNAEDAFCDMFFLEKKQLREMKELKTEIMSSLKRMNIQPVYNRKEPSTMEKDLSLKLAIFAAFYPNYFVKTYNSEKENTTVRLLNKRDPKSCLYLTGFPREQAMYGQLYKNQIKDCLKSVTSMKEKINLHFDGGNVIVEFDRHIDSRGNRNSELEASEEVMTEVFIGVKLRKISRSIFSQPEVAKSRTNMRIAVYSTEVAEKIHTEWMEKGKGSEQHAGEKKKYHCVPMDPPGMDAPDSECNAKILNLVLKYVESPQLFWVGEVSNQNGESRLNRLISATVQSCPRLSPGEVEVGCIYLAPFHHSDSNILYYRVMVEAILPGKKARVLFVDYGNEVSLNVECLRNISPDIARDVMEIPALAVKCSIAGLQPNGILSSAGHWNPEILGKFKDLMSEAAESGRVVLGRVYSCVKINHGVNKFQINFETLVVHSLSQNCQIEVYQWLLESGFTQLKVESYVSQEDARNRQNFLKFDKEMQDFLNKKDRFFQQSDLKEPDKTPRDDFSKMRSRVELKGPFSPLECGVSSLFNNSTKRAKIERQSVNDVMLDQNMSEKHEMWLVAANVAVSGQGTEMVLRETSLMPARIGLGPLCAIMFSPRVELYRSKSGGYYSGCVIGLGPKEGSGRGYYPEHDSQLWFDFRLSADDVNSVNQVRYYINQILGRNEDGDPKMSEMGTLARFQTDVMEIVKKLLMKRFDYQKQEYNILPSGDFWGKMEKKSRTSLQYSYKQDEWIYKLLEGPILQKSGHQVPSDQNTPSI